MAVKSHRKSLGRRFIRLLIPGLNSAAISAISAVVLGTFCFNGVHPVFGQEQPKEQPAAVPPVLPPVLPPVIVPEFARSTGVITDFGPDGILFQTADSPQSMKCLKC